MRLLAIALLGIGCAATPSPSASASPSPSPSTTATSAPTTPGTTLGEPIGAACKADQTPCGNGPHAACCNHGEMCCAGGAAGSYYCKKGEGMCPPLP